MDTRIRASIKITALQRLLMINLLSGVLPLYIVTEYPKSGGTWLSQMLSDYLQVPFPRNEFPKFESCIMHGHYIYNAFLMNVFCVMRDGRDIMVSYYYHSLFRNERFNARLVEITRREVPFKNYDNIEDNLPAFIEYKFTRKKYPRFTWADFVNSWADKDVAIIRYENLLRDSVKELGESIKKVVGYDTDEKRLTEIVERYSFKRLAKRNPGEENKHSFLRKGIAGDWKNVFNKEAKELFNYYAGKELIKLGYEKDESWVYGN
ncbi:MAG: sulfotransferase domain-containing protein [Deltaproteobacteria bacterium]|nr:sulfotransferase domain-containing protein [Deltaproteobacteria bacterium]